MTHPDIIYWLALSRIPGIGPVTVKRYLEQCGDIKTLFSKTPSELTFLGLSEKQITHLQRPDFHSAERDLRWSEKNNVHILTLICDNYPPLLREISDPPLILYVRSDLPLLLVPQIAIVGSRNPTTTGRALSEHFAYALAKEDLCITSGLALGIDAAAHLGAMKAGGKTLAVFGCGLNCIYPQTNRSLAEKVLANGAWISEFPPDELPKARNFPRRNRIISGLSLGVLVIEAAVRSGSLITARLAVEQGRNVFAVPGSIHNPLSRGCHELIKQGAKLVEKAEDILAELGPLQAFIYQETKAPDLEKLDVKSKHLLGFVDYEVTAIDAIIIRSGLTAGEVCSMLLSLELSGYVQNVQGGYLRVT